MTIFSKLMVACLAVTVYVLSVELFEYLTVQFSLSSNSSYQTIVNIFNTFMGIIIATIAYYDGWIQSLMNKKIGTYREGRVLSMMLMVDSGYKNYPSPTELYEEIEMVIKQTGNEVIGLKPVMSGSSNEKFNESYMTLSIDSDKLSKEEVEGNLDKELGVLKERILENMYGEDKESQEEEVENK